MKKLCKCFNIFIKNMKLLLYNSNKNRKTYFLTWNYNIGIHVYACVCVCVLNTLPMCWYVIFTQAHRYAIKMTNYIRLTHTKGSVFFFPPSSHSSSCSVLLSSALSSPMDPESPASPARIRTLPPSLHPPDQWACQQRTGAGWGDAQCVSLFLASIYFPLWG